MNILVFLLIVIVLVVGSYFIYSHFNKTKTKYQGPVPEGYDEDYFRETGITKLLEVKG